MPEKRVKAKAKKNGLAGTITAGIILLSLAVSGVLVKFGWEQYQKDSQSARAAAERNKQRDEREAKIRALPSPPSTIVDNSVAATIKDAASKGWKPCPGDCLKLATPGWHKHNYEGFAPTDWWMAYPLSQGRHRAFSQRHVGHIIKNDGTDAIDTGNCPVCNGTGWVPKDFK